MAEPLLNETTVPERGAARAEAAGEERLRRMKGGDRSAFEGFYREHAGRVYGLCVRLARDRDRAEEMTQEVFVRAWQHRRKLSSAAHARNWLHRVALMGELESPAAVEPLVRALADGHRRVREASLEALAELDDGRAIDAVTTLLEDGHGRVRRAAAETLAELEDD